MTIRAAAVGFSQSVTTEVTARWVLAYAAALGLVDEAHLDDARPGGPVVPPTFCVCLEWALAGSDERSAALGLGPEERRRSVHALQDSRFLRPLAVGMRVTTTGRIEFMRGTSAGTLVLSRLDTREASGGAVLVTSWSASIVRGIALDAPTAGVPPTDLDAPAEALPADAAEIRIPIDRGLPHVYSECARIWNPIHTERAVALRAGLGDIILHGTATWALAGREIVRAQAAGDGRRLRRLAARFRAPVVPGGPVTLRHAPGRLPGEVRYTVATTTGEVAVVAGRAALAAEPA